MKTSDQYNKHLAEVERQHNEDLRLEAEAQILRLTSKSRRNTKYYTPQIHSNMSPLGISIELGYPSWSKYLVDGDEYYVFEVVEIVLNEIKALPTISEYRESGFKRCLALQILKASSNWRKIGNIHIFSNQSKTIIIQ